MDASQPKDPAFGQANRCLSCNACRTACTIQQATNQLHPLKIVRLAAHGLHENLALWPEVWACLQCNHCSQMCPMGVEPSALIRRLRVEAARTGALGVEALHKVEEQRARLQRVRWHMIRRCAAGFDTTPMLPEYDRWASTPVDEAAETLTWAGGDALAKEVNDRVGYATDLSACMACRACTTACPISWDAAVYDPVVLFRMVNLGFDEVLRSPSLWLCVGCGGCALACTQGVHGHVIVQALRDIAVSRGVVPADMAERVWAAQRPLLGRFLEQLGEINELRWG